MRGHDQVVLGGDVVAAIARPSDVESLALYGATRHLDELGDNAHLRMIVKIGVFHNRAVHQGQSQVASVDGKADALRAVHARLAAAKLRLVGDIIMDEGCGMEVLDSRRRAGGQAHVAAYGQACGEADERAMALAAVFAIPLQRRVQVTIHVGVRSRGKVGVHQIPYLIGIGHQIAFEGFRGFGYVCDDLVDVLHSAFLIRIACMLLAMVPQAHYAHAPLRTSGAISQGTSN